MRRALLLFAAVFAVAQTTSSPVPYTYVWDAGARQWRLDPIQGATEAIVNGVHVVQLPPGPAGPVGPQGPQGPAGPVGAQGPAAPAYSFQSGLITVQAPGLPVQVSLDSAYVLYRGAPPSDAGQACGPSVGTGAIAVSAATATVPAYVFLCVPDGTGQGFVWGKMALQLTPGQ